MNGNCNGRGGTGCAESEYIRRHHTHNDLADHQCSSSLVKHIKAPVQLVWSLVRRFDQPQKYKPFISRCVVLGNLEIGSLREVDVRHISLHPEIIDGRPGTLVIESFVVDVPDGNTKDETCYFVEALIKCNLKSLADVSEHLAVQDRTEPIDCM
uniref:Abscisic acid receptor PYL8 n=1 Tax=Salix viminalis TaxID=40686 RepID=A0A6N2LLH3_SALVM